MYTNWFNSTISCVSCYFEGQPLAHLNDTLIIAYGQQTPQHRQLVLSATSHIAQHLRREISGFFDDSVSFSIFHRSLQPSRFLYRLCYRRVDAK